MKTRHAFLALALLTAALLAPSGAQGAGEECQLEPRARCFGVESLEATLSTAQAGAHPNLIFAFAIKEDPQSKPNAFGLKDAYAPTRDVRIELPPGLIGDPNVLGTPQQCKLIELNLEGCPNGSQVGVSQVFAYELNDSLLEPVYMMQPPGGDSVARLGVIAGLSPLFINIKVRSESDYGLTAEFIDAPTLAKLVKAETTTWGVPAASSHNTERCTPGEALNGCKISPPRPPGSRPLPFFTNPTHCSVPLEMRVGASSWVEPDRFDFKSASFPEITGCNRLPFGPDLTIEPTNHRADTPTGLEATVRLPASDGVTVLEPSEMREARIDLPAGLAFNPGAADGLATCSEKQVRYEERVAAECPDAAKVAAVEFDIPALPRRMKGAVYLREPEPGNPFRAWFVADDLGAHVKLPAQLDVDRGNGQITSILLDPSSPLEGIPETPLREARLNFFAGARAPLVNPQSCGTYETHFDFTPWSGNPNLVGDTPMTIDEGCNTGGFAPELSGGTTDLTAGQHSPFVFRLTREDGEQNPAALDIVLPQGLTATFAGVPRCEGAAAVSGQCPNASQIGVTKVAAGAGSAPLWIPQAGKRPTAVYLGGPYKGAPFSVIVVAPAQAGPFDFGDQVVRSAINVDPVKAQGIVRSDPLPQIIEGTPITYRTIYVELNRPDFTLNPTSCKEKSIDATVTSAQGAVAQPSARFGAVACSSLDFKPKISFKLLGGTHRGAHPRLKAMVKARPGDANIGGTSVALPHSEFLDQSHIGTVCTRVQFAAKNCPTASVYGHAVARTPLLDKPLEGPVYLRSSSHPLPDLVMRLGGELEIELAGRVDSVKGGIRTSFEAIPDAPVTSFSLSMQGGKKGLLVNSTNLCAKTNHATAKFTAQNDQRLTLHPPMQATCGKNSN
jgi:hypothetical protein